MERKYWVPALERAHEVLKRIAEAPSKLRLMDLTASTGINKSTMFSLLQTMEALDWVTREKGDTYSLGSTFAYLGNAYFSNISLVELFRLKAAGSVERLGETLQLSRLDGTHIIYLAKREAVSPVRLISEPGMRIPAYATAMGKMLLSFKSDEEVRALYMEETFHTYTPNTVGSVDELIPHLSTVRECGYAIDDEEAVPGFVCVAAPVCVNKGQPTAAISFSMPLHHWESKREAAIEEVKRLADELSASL